MNKVSEGAKMGALFAIDALCRREAAGKVRVSACVSVCLCVYVCLAACVYSLVSQVLTSLLRFPPSTVPHVRIHTYTLHIILCYIILYMHRSKRTSAAASPRA